MAASSGSGTAFLLSRIAFSAAIAAGVARRGLRRKSLSAGGALAAAVVGFLSMAAAWRFGITLLAFYYTSSKLTRVGAAVKEKLDDGYKPGGQRDAEQVLSCSAFAVVVAVAYAALFGGDSGCDWRASAPAATRMASQLHAAYLAFFACCAGDTWASELGILDPAPPRLITSFFLRRVPHGTNGGMSRYGTAASLAAGLFLGVVYAGVGALTASALPTQPAQLLPMIVCGGAAGFVGSCIDSLLGATLQASWYSEDRHIVLWGGDKPQSGYNKHICGAQLLSNTQVNVVSAVLTSVLFAFASPALLAPLQ